MSGNPDWREDWRDSNQESGEQPRPITPQPVFTSPLQKSLYLLPQKPSPKAGLPKNARQQHANANASVGAGGGG
eukprot:scaffold1187_cov20-Tisochrysis_lutea.AAC.1